MELIRQVDIDAFKSGIDAFSDHLKVAGKALQQFGRVYYSVARQSYRAEVGKLPGSDRTKRLRKKRQKIVLDWFRMKLEEAGRENHGL